MDLRFLFIFSIVSGQPPVVALYCVFARCVFIYVFVQNMITHYAFTRFVIDFTVGAIPPWLPIVESPWLPIVKNNYTMDMIRHDLKFININPRIINRQFIPDHVYHSPRIIKHHFIIYHIPEETFFVLRANGYEICAGL